MSVLPQSLARLTASRLPLAFAVFVLVALAGQAGAVVRLVYPLMAIAIAFRLLATSTSEYVRFVIWLWVLSPFVRRVADLQAGWQDPSLVLLTPYLVTSVCWVHVAARIVLMPHAVRVRLPVGGTMFLLAALGAAVGIPVGFAAGHGGAALETLNWIVPLGFGAYIASCRDEIGELERTIVAVFTRMAVLVGLYGVYQFFTLPDWDANWMVNSAMTSLGFAEAFAVRVFSTMHSPGVLGYFTIAPVVFWMARPRFSGLGPVCLAAVTLLLSQVRTAWLGFALSAILVLPSLRLMSGVRVLLFALLGALCVTPFLQLPEVSDRVNARLETIRDLPSYDTSAVARLEGHHLTLDFMVRHPFGVGIGASPPEIEKTIGMRDSILVAGLVQFGFLGMTLHLLSLVALGAILFRSYRHAPTPEALGIACTGLGMLGTVVLGIPNAGPPGVVLWLTGGLAAARLAQREGVGMAPAFASVRPAAGLTPATSGAAGADS